MNHEDLILRDLMETSDEIYDIPEMKDDKFDVEKYINSNYDYWLRSQNSLSFKIMNSKQLQELKANYASLIVDGMDMRTLETFAMEMVEENMKDWDEDDVKQEIVEHYGEETWNDMNDFSTESGQYSISDLEATADDYGVGKWNSL